jgi:heme/copper-type cytochrome/quinol oxidase subunit 1
MVCKQLAMNFITTILNMRANPNLLKRYLLAAWQHTTVAMPKIHR